VTVPQEEAGSLPTTAEGGQPADAEADTAVETDVFSRCTEWFPSEGGGE
jgi:hypothetical protein